MPCSRFIQAVCGLLTLTVALPWAQGAEGDLRAEIEALKKQLAARNQPAPAPGAGVVSRAEEAIANKYGPNAAVTTKQGKLTISGLVQVWYYSIQNDRLGFFGDLRRGGSAGDTNEGKDNDSFRLRRAEIQLTADVTEYVQAVVQIDPAREATSFPALPSNLGTFLRDRTTNQAAIQDGAGGAARMLKNAYVRFHTFVPHHDFSIGQHKLPTGEEGARSAAELDFVERWWGGCIGDDTRDLGLTAHGTWVDDRVQYWLTASNGAGDYFGSRGQMPNRSDDNDQKDLLYRLQFRPVWKDETWGGLELGGGSQFGFHGEAGDPGFGNVDGLNRRRTDAFRHFAWAGYFPGGPVKGWWLRGEWLWLRDRNAPATVRSLVGGLLTGPRQTAPHALDTSGWYVATGYDLAKSVWADGLPKWLKPTEFAFRYQEFGNVMVADLVYPMARTDVFSSRVWTAGVNYYLKGHNAKVQANYNWVNEPNEDSNQRARGFREVRNDNLMVNFQVAW